jgi:DnaJ-class molecular chaperone
MFNIDSNYVHSGNALWSAGNLTVTFTTTATDLQFYVIAMDTSVGNKAADINIYKGTTLDSTYELMGTGTPAVPFLVDLSSYGEIDKIDLVVTDPSGLTYDTFTFTIEI